MIGTEPHTQWLQSSVARGDQGFILTGPDLLTAGQAHCWPLERPRSCSKQACRASSQQAT
jgi:hypothetical protein